MSTGTLPTTHRAVAALSPGSWDVISIPTPEPNPGEVTVTAAEKVLPWV